MNTCEKCNAIAAQTPYTILCIDCYEQGIIELAALKKRVAELEAFKDTAQVAKLMHECKIREFQDHHAECESIVASANERVAELEAQLNAARHDGC